MWPATVARSTSSEPQAENRKETKKKNKEELFPKLSSLLYFGAYFIEAKWRCSSRQHILIQSQHSPPPFLPPAISSAKQLRENLLICSRCCCCLFAGLLLARNSTFWLPAKCCECPQCMPHHTPHTPHPTQPHHLIRHCGLLECSPCRINLVFSTSP